MKSWDTSQTPWVHILSLIFASSFGDPGQVYIASLCLSFLTYNRQDRYYKHLPPRIVMRFIQVLNVKSLALSPF